MNTLKNVTRIGSSMLLSFALYGIAGAQTASTTPGTPTTALGGNLVLNVLAIVFSLTLITTGIVLSMGEKKHSYI